MDVVIVSIHCLKCGQDIKHMTKGKYWGFLPMVVDRDWLREHASEPHRTTEGCSGKVQFELEAV